MGAKSPRAVEIANLPRRCGLSCEAPASALAMNVFVVVPVYNEATVLPGVVELISFYSRNSSSWMMVQLTTPRHPTRPAGYHSEA